MNYHPKPIDTSNVELPEEIAKLGEQIAENTHDVWAKQRMEQGWKYGKTRSDTEKTSPCLVPYSELPEAEKEYDRSTSQETLKVILKLGYKIVKGEAK